MSKEKKDLKAAISQFDKVFKIEQNKLLRSAKSAFLRDFEKAYMHMRSLAPSEQGDMPESLVNLAIHRLIEARERLAYAYKKEINHRNADIGFAIGTLLGFADHILPSTLAFTKHGYEESLYEIARSFDTHIKQYYEVDSSFIKERFQEILKENKNTDPRIKRIIRRFAAEFVVTSKKTKTKDKNQEKTA